VVVIGLSTENLEKRRSSKKIVWYEDLNPLTRFVRVSDKRREYKYLNKAVKICKKGLAEEKKMNI